MATIHLKLRSDLEFKAESSAPESPVIVKDPIARRFYRFTPVQASVLQQLDGVQDPALIASIVSEKLGTTVLTDQVEEFAGKLQNLCLLDHPVCWAKLEKAGRRSHRFLNSILSIKIHAFNPDQFLGAAILFHERICSCGLCGLFNCPSHPIFELEDHNPISRSPVCSLFDPAGSPGNLVGNDRPRMCPWACA
jgi:hypothetical protein